MVWHIDPNGHICKAVDGWHWRIFVQWLHKVKCILLKRIAHHLSMLHPDVGSAAVFHASRFAHADDAGANGSANVSRPLCGLLLYLAKPQVHAAPSAPVSSVITYRKHFEEWVFECLSDFYMF